MPEPGDDELQATPRSERADRAEAIATLVALLWVSTVAIVFAVFGGNISLVGLLAIGPFIAAAFARPSRVAMVGILAAFFALVISTPPHSYGELNHTLRVLTQLAATALAMWISYLRGQRNVQLWTARSETRNERRRRVAAETAQRMQAMARALTTAADPAQVADAVFAALRDELHVDAATFALLERARAAATRCAASATTPASRATGCSPRSGPTAPCSARTSPSSPNRSRTSAASAPTSMRRSLRAGSGPWPSIPLVVSDHTIGAVVVHWDDDREISEPDRELPLHHHRRGRPGRRARPPHPDRVRQPRAEPAPAPAELRAGSRYDAGRRGPCGDRRGRRALGAQSAVVRVPAAGERSLSCLASSGHPALLSRGMVPVDGSRAGVCFSAARPRSCTSVGERRISHRRRR